MLFLLEFSPIRVSLRPLEAYLQILWECVIAYSRRWHSYEVLQATRYTLVQDQVGCIWESWLMSMWGLSVISEWSWRLWAVPDDRENTNVKPSFTKVKEEDLGRCELISLTSVLGEVMQWIMFKTIPMQLMEKKVIGSSLWGFIKGESCLINLIAFYEEMTGSVNLVRATDIIYLDLTIVV